MIETPERDHELGAQLRALPVPSHRPAFERELRARLERPHRRLTWPGGHRLRLAMAGAATAAAVGIAALAIGLPGESSVATAAELRAAVARALSSVEALEGVFVNRESGGESRWRFTVAADGSFRITSVTHAGDLAYDARRNVETYSDGPLFVSRRGIAPGPPDADASPWVIERDLAAVVGALARAGDADVEETEYEGRPAWLLRTPTGNPGETREITVDRESSIPVRVQRLRQGRVQDGWRVEGLRTGSAPAPDRFRQQPRAGQEQTSYNMGFRRLPLAEVQREVGYAPLVPQWLPEGFELAEVAAALRSRPTGSEQRQNPPSRNVVSLGYRRGLDRLVVTTRLLVGDRGAWIDPATVGILSRRPEAVTFGEGALAGVTGELVFDPNETPHVWALTDRLVVTVTGDVGRDDLLQVAESLR